MRLSQQIVEIGMSAAVARTFAMALREVARADGPINELESRLIRHLVEEVWASDEVAAPFEALWGHAELFLTACVYVAVADGDYGLEEARVISLFAHRLGYSVRRLASLETRTFAALRARAPASPADLRLTLPPPLASRRVALPPQTQPALLDDDGRVEHHPPRASRSMRTEDGEDLDGEEVTEPLYR